MATHAGFWNDLASASAGRAALLNAEKTLAHLHRTRPGAGAAGFDLGAGFGAAAFAGFARLPTGNADLRVLALGCFLQRDFHRVAQIAAAVHLPAATGATALLTEHVPKNIAKRFREAAEAFLPTGAAHIRVHAGMAILVVGGALLGVRQHLVGFFGLLELLFRNLGRFTLVSIRMVLHRQLAVGFLDLFLGCVLRYAQGLVVVSFGHRRSQVMSAKRRVDDLA